MELKGQTIGIGLVSGITIGAVVGSITGNIGIWVSMGVVFGLVFGLGISTVLASQATEANDASLPSDSSEE